ncbi:MAG: cytochrome [Verrucomicrobiales bacterium]|nr:cytochrome [Verrucomicrobiales bacterium]
MSSVNQRLGIVAAVWLTVTGSAESVNYMKEIKPILSTACYQCHSATQQKHNLRVDTATSILKGGDHGPAIVRGKSDESLLIKAVQGVAKDLSRMPFKKAPLDEEKIALLKRWIDEGAKAPADEKPDAVLHWSFVPPPSTVAVPAVKNKKWVRNPIDNFILARLEKQKIKPAKEADKITLIRRLYLDLIGLPPKISDVDTFVNDHRADAYERLVEQLLSNPHYGERQARHWLDAAHYADSNGFSVDAPRQIWKYRDWVINAFNKDLPFDEFTIEQIAGDLLPKATTEQRVATGFYRNTMINQEGGIDKEQFRIESVLDRVNTTGTTWLGLTIGCSQCHDHKFDPLMQKEYYQLFAFLNNQDEPDLELLSNEEKQEIETAKKHMQEAEIALNIYIKNTHDEIVKWEKALTAEQTAKLKLKVQQSLVIPAGKRSFKEKLLLVDQIRKEDETYKHERAKLARAEAKNREADSTMVLQERKEARESFLFIKGDFTRHGDRVSPGFPKIVQQQMPASATPAAGTNLTRLDLAKWLVEPENPLTARVTVNRIWMHCFGKGLVETDNDFGTQGSAPTHPALLDWLAREFTNQKWSVKQMHRLIVMSATYRQSSDARRELKDVDPYNKLFARQNRFRLEAEVVRDSELTASGLLTEKIGGPSVFPPIPDGVMKLGQMNREWNVSPGDDKYRRGMYTFFYRATPPPALVVFDAPDSSTVCTRRLRSNTPLQSLTLLNEQSFVELAQGLASRVLSEAPKEGKARLDYAFRLCLSRHPEKSERERLATLLDAEKRNFAAAPTEAKALAPKELIKEADVKEFAAWTTISRVLLNLDETISRE